MNEMQAGQVSQAELNWRKHHNCFSPGCRNFTFLRDWAGWVWCLKHYWKQLWLIEHKGNRWHYLWHTEIVK